MIPSVIVPITHKEILNAIKTDLLNDKNNILEFEQRFSEYIGCDHAIATHSGTAALYVLLKAYGLENGDEVIVPAYTCETLARLIIDMEYKIKFVDVDKETYNMSVEDLCNKINKNTKAIVAAHMFGNPCEIKDIMEIAEDYNAIVIEDAAQSIGAEYYGKKVGNLGDSGFFSLGEGKPITTINGGLIVTNDKQIANRSIKFMANFKDFGMGRKFLVFMKLIAYYVLKNPYFYDLIYKMIQSRRFERRDKLKKCANLDGFKLKYTDMQASVGMIQFSNLDSFNDARIKNAEFLINHLKKVDGVHLPKIAKHSKPIFLRLPIWIENIKEGERVNLINRLQKSGIDAPVAYPNSLPKFFFNSNGYPNTEELVKKTITLPTHPLVKEIDLKKIVEIIGGALNETPHKYRTPLSCSFIQKYD